MITTGSKYGGLEHSNSAFKKLDMKVEQALCAINGGNGESWVGRIWGVNVVFYVSGSLIPDAGVRRIEAKRFSRAQKLLLVNVPVPDDILDDFQKSLAFTMYALQEAVVITAAVFAKKRVGPFDVAKAQAIIEQVRERVSQKNLV